MIRPDSLRGRCGKAYLVGNGSRIPGLTHTKTVHIAYAHIGHHLRRRNRDHTHILEWVDAVIGQPVIQPHGMRAGRKGLCKGVLTRSAGDFLFQGFTIAYVGVAQLIRQGNALAILVQSHQDRHFRFGPSHAQVHPVHHAVQHVREIQVAGA